MSSHIRLPLLLLLLASLAGVADAKLPPAPKDKENHWSFKPPVRPEVPAAKNAAWVRNPIDAFVAAEHDRLGLTPRPEAPKHVLLRRVYLDLTGLPPTRQQLHAFLNDTRPDAYERVVDELLASPAYGERWGRHWMDVWRYSDWAGYAAEVRESQPHVWRWRDWIVESLNGDRPYDQMVREMLAGDEIAPADPNTLRATGYLARNWYKFNRNVWLENTVEHSAKAFLGVTMNCARCHDHMYDPVTQKEHYRFRAFFEPYDVRTDRVPGEPDTAKAGLVRVYDKELATPTFLFQRGDEKSPVKEEPLAPAVPAVLGGTVDVKPVALARNAHYQGLEPWLREEVESSATKAVADTEAAVSAADKSVADAQKQLDTLLHSASQPPAEAGATPPAPLEANKTTVLFDDFSKPRPDLWKTESGQWEHREGELVQSQPGADFRRIVSLTNHPADFTARFRFTTTGGDKWFSVGLSFDVTEGGDANSVYLSATGGGPGAAIQFTRSGQHVYPDNGLTALPVRLNTPYELRVDVRDRLLNVFVDDVPVKVFTLPQPRTPAKFAVWTYDAKAEFDAVRVDPLPADAKLMEKIDAAPALKPNGSHATEQFAAARAALDKAQSLATLARLKLAAARAEKQSVDARLAADDARFRSPPAADADALAVAATRAERNAAAWRAEQELADAQQAASAKKGDADAAKKVTEATKKLEEARAKAAQPAGKDYTTFTEVYPATSTGRRLALAHWITSRQNPLAARVAVNHMWGRHFGEGIVPTVFDFGLNGMAPTNQPLLDWLAVELMDCGWKMKHLHRLIVTSAAYRMDSRDDETGETNRQKDPDNKYVWRAPVRRMEAELVRDGVLHLAGKLDATTGGPELDHVAGLTTFRRSLYYRHAHEKQMTFLKLFDAANPNECYRRHPSVVPQQALALANSPLAIAQSRLLAAKLKDEPDFLTAAFESVLCRPPTSEERALCDEFLTKQSKALAEKSSLTPFAAGDAPPVPPSDDPKQRARENLVHVLVNHNDFVTIR